MHALVVDDSRALRTILRRILETLGFAVAEAGSGDAALACCRAQRPDVVLVDWNMPGMDGLTFVRAVRADPALAGTRVLMVTSEGGAGQIATALEAGADDYVFKPFTPDVITQRLQLAGVLR